MRDELPSKAEVSSSVADGVALPSEAWPISSAVVVEGEGADSGAAQGAGSWRGRDVSRGRRLRVL